MKLVGFRDDHREGALNICILSVAIVTIGRSKTIVAIVLSCSVAIVTIGRS